MPYDAVIIGAGACGLMCAVQAGKLGKQVCILEGNNRIGAKILISGGGRCNYTNLEVGSENYISRHPDLLAEVMQHWTVEDTLNFFQEQGIYGEEKTLGQLFPIDKKAKDVVDVFARLLKRYGVGVKLQTKVTEVKQTSSGYAIVYTSGKQKQVMHAKQVVFASGGLPVSKLGATDLALRVAGKLGMELQETRPALVPLTITGKDAPWFAALAGNTLACRVSNERAQFTEQILFTHWGLSGPAILQISSYWRPGEYIELDLLPHVALKDLIRLEREAGGRRLLRQLLEKHFTQRFALALGKFLPIETKIASLSRKDAEAAVQFIHHFRIKVAGDKGYDKAEVMRGGISLNELNPQSLEAYKMPGLYFGGECVDVTGWLGGYNFQWAWVSGFVIAQAI